MPKKPRKRKTKKALDWENNDLWTDFYLQELEERNVPYVIMKELGVPMEELRRVRKDLDGFAQREHDAAKFYEESLLEEMAEYVEEFPALKYKFTERVVERLKPETAKTTVNIDNSQRTVNLLGITDEECYADTSKLLQAIQPSEKILVNTEPKQLVDVTPGNPNN